MEERRTQVGDRERRGVLKVGVKRPSNCCGGGRQKAFSFSQSADGTRQSATPSLPTLRKNKNRLSSTTCGEDSQKIFKDWQSLKGLCQKAPKKSPILSDSRFWPFLSSKWPQNSNLTWSLQHNLGVPEILNFIKIFVWALLGPWNAI